ncbi:LamB/YcsF family protein [Cucumibacter marinus]|uniref:LamB/YcsF family protein n=1 Tax=Cucumibacter marinus TaxID=1121252 RepID=UPI000427D013|nr:5-oxoprolinase subunit PxpA [Cucumibacter marinus]
MKTIDLNADLGEGMGDDDAMFEIVTSASIACGGHAGTRKTIRHALQQARKHGVIIGAHPGYEDRENFGRVPLELSESELEDQVTRQLEGMIEIAIEEQADVRYVKLHGALANLASTDEKTAEAAFKAVARISEDFAILALESSAQERVARDLGLEVFTEAYADRRYGPDGLLLSRRRANSVITEPDDVVEQCLRLAERHEIVAAEGSVLTSKAQSICLHGDTKNAVALAKAVRAALEEAGVSVSSFI